MRISILLITFLVFSGICRAQDHHIYGLFPTYNLNGKINDKFTASVYSFLAIYTGEQTTREVTYPSKVNAFYIEADLSYNISKACSFTGSYTYERVNPFRKNYRNEHRAWLQAQYYKPLGKVNLKNRLRYDFRFIYNRTTDQADFRPRLRYLLGIDFSVNDNGLYIAAYNEFFFDMYKDRIAAYSENWAFAGIGFSLSENLKLETGPLVISWIRNDDKDWLHQYFLQLTLIHNIDL